MSSTTNKEDLVGECDPARVDDGNGNRNNTETNTTNNSTNVNSSSSNSSSSSNNNNDPKTSSSDSKTNTNNNNEPNIQNNESQNVDSPSPSSSSSTVDAVNFPIEDLQRLDEMLNRTRWIVPVLPKSELECLLDASIRLCKLKIDTKSEHCQRFFRDGLTLSFVRVMTDDAVNTWKYDIYKHIYNNSLKAIELCTLKLLDDWFPLLDLLAIILNPQCKYHIINSLRASDLNVKVTIKTPISSAATDRSTAKTSDNSSTTVQNSSERKIKVLKVKNGQTIGIKKKKKTTTANKQKQQQLENKSETKTNTQTDSSFNKETQIIELLEKELDKSITSPSSSNNPAETDTQNESIKRTKLPTNDHENDVNTNTNDSNTNTTNDDEISTIKTTTTTTIHEREKAEQDDSDLDDDEYEDDDDGDEQDADDDEEDDEEDEVEDEDEEHLEDTDDADEDEEEELEELFDELEKQNDRCYDDDENEPVSGDVEDNNDDGQTSTKKRTTSLNSKFNKDSHNESNNSSSNHQQQQQQQHSKNLTPYSSESDKNDPPSDSDNQKQAQLQQSPPPGLPGVQGEQAKKSPKTAKSSTKKSKKINKPKKQSLKQKGTSTSPNYQTIITTYARTYTKSAFGWLIDFINHFGELNGFAHLLERFTTTSVKLNIQVIAALLKPWGLCYQFLTPYTVKTFFLPVIEIVSKFFENLSDEDIAKECKSENKNDSISTVIKWLKLLASRVQSQHELCKSLEILRLKTILRILKYASFNGKMNALNEVNKVISNITCNVQVSGSIITSGGGLIKQGGGGGGETADEEWLTSDRMAKWIQENDVLDIVLRDCMHQPQYVEKLERILRFLIKEKALTLKDLDKIWESQMGKHEAIEKNVHDLLSKLAWDFSPEQLDHLFSCFQKSWTNASKKQREKLLDLIRSLSEDDKEGVMANKVLDLLWNLAHSDDAPTEIIDQAVAAHIKILDYSCSSDKESQKLKYLEKCIEQLKENKWVIVSLRQIREILQQFPEMISGSFQTHRLLNYPPTSTNMFLSGNTSGTLHGVTATSTNNSPVIHNQSNSVLVTSTSGSGGGFHRPDIIAKLQKEYSLISMITSNLADYYENIRKSVQQNANSGESSVEPDTILPDGRFNHCTQIQERLNFLKYLLKEGQLWLCSAQAETVWKCLAQNSVFELDREICFKWFSKLMTDDPDLEPDMNKTFFTDYITKLDPKLLTDSGIKCFDRFFKYVNLKYNRLVQKRSYFLTDSLDLIGLDYLWKIVTFANEDIVEKAILLLKDIYIHLGPQLKAEQSAIHADLISNCMDRLRVSFDNLSILYKGNSDEQRQDELRIKQEITQILRVLIVLREYLNEFDSNYSCERIYAPLSRASKGKSLLLVVRLQIQNRPADDIELISHVNETIGSIRRQIYIKTKLNPQMNKIDLIINNDCVECMDDNKILGDFPLKEKMFIIARISQTASGLNLNSSTGMGTSAAGVHATTRLDSSADSSSDDGASSNDDSHNVVSSPNLEYELMLPSLILSLNEPYIQFLIELADFGCKLNNAQIKEYTRGILDLLPIAKHTAEKVRQICKESAQKQHENETKTTKPSPSQTTPESSNILQNFFTNCTQNQCWYNLKVTHALLIPAVFQHNPDETRQFQENFILAGGVTCFQNMLVKDNFMTNADDNTKKAALLYVLKINKLTMTTVCHGIFSYVLNAIQTKQFSQINEAQHSHALLLQNSVSSIPSNTNEITIRTLAQRLGAQFASLLVNQVPDLSHIIKLERIAWSLAANGTLDLVKTTTTAIATTTTSSTTKPNAVASSPTAYEHIHETLMENRHTDCLMQNLDDINVCREALECLALSLSLVPQAIESLNQEKHWRTFLVDMVLLCANRLVRQTASEQFLLIALKCSLQPNRPIQFFIQMLFTCLHSLNKENSHQSQEYFYLLCRLLNCAYVNSVQISNTETLLNNEIVWLKKLKQAYVGGDEAGHSQQVALAKKLPPGAGVVAGDQQLIDEMLLDGHLNITKELLQFQSAEKKYHIGCHPQGHQLINDLVEYFIFPASCLFKKYRDSLIAVSTASTTSSSSTQVWNKENASSQLAALNNVEQMLASKSLKSICSSSMTINSAFDLLVALCTGCLANFQTLSDLLFNLFYPSLLPSLSTGKISSQLPQQPPTVHQPYDYPASLINNQLTNDCTIAQNEWEYLPPIGQRPQNGFVGLKNAGATCYMNSVLQQLFMIKKIRNYILGVDLAAATAELNQSSSGTNAAESNAALLDDLDDPDTTFNSSIKKDHPDNEGQQLSKAQSEEEQRKEYNITIFKHLQMIFGHLAESKMQYYVPKGFWRQFRFGGGEKVNLREQHDAVEFFNSVVDCIDEAMKQLSGEQICSKVLGGTFADQKICKGCPHRYSREESFTLLSVDVKHSQRLSESLEQYVKGDLLEGPNAYHCEKCNKKIDAVKRTCIKKLPAVLAIQLKRFDYDWEREIAVKSNEYFEFPRELDMEPYTVRGVARIERQQELAKKQQMQKQLEQQLKQQQQDTESESSTTVKSPIGDLKSELESLNTQCELNLDEDEEGEDASVTSVYSNNYRLVGIVVHSGQANGGHYYSFIQNKLPSSSVTSSDDEPAIQTSIPGGAGAKQADTNASSNNEAATTGSVSSLNSNENNWFKFDDNEVTEFKMDDEEMRNQCYGGDYTGEVYDNVMKRMAYKKQKRWWNAYILFYERIKHDQPKTTTQIEKATASNNNNDKELNNEKTTSCGELLQAYDDVQYAVKMPAYIVKSVHKKNIKFLHHRHHFSPEYFQFIKKLSQANISLIQTDSTLNENMEEICLATVKMAFKFLFSVGFRVKKSLRGPVNEWYDVFFNYAKHSTKARHWMVYYLLIENSVILAQYFLDCPSNEIRNTFNKIIVALVHLTYSDPPMEVKLNDLMSLPNQPSLTVLVTSNETSAHQTTTISLNSLVNSLHASSSSTTSTLTSLENKFYNFYQSDSLIHTLLSLLSKRDLINEQSSKYLIQYFQFFNYYLSLGIQQCAHLIHCDVPYVFMQFALDELPMTLSNINLNSISSSSLSSGSSSFSLNYSKFSQNINPNNSNYTSSQYADLSKLYSATSTLLRCYDISAYCQPSAQNPGSPNASTFNPYSHINELKQQENYNVNAPTNVNVKMPNKIADMLFKRTNFLKKLLEDAPNLEETVKLMRFLCWENMNFSMDLLNELLWMTAYHYSYELKPHLDTLYHVLNINDSWQTRRIMCALQGIPNDRDGLFEIITRSQNHYQKRAYQIIKMLVQLFTNCEIAFDLLNKDEELKRKWKQSRNWFYNEMEKCRLYNMPNYYQTPQSNETSQTYFLERTQSARLTLEKAMKICPQIASSSSSSNTAVTTGANRSNSNNNNNNSNNNATEENNDEQPEQENENVEHENENELGEEDDDDDEEEEDVYESISDEDNHEIVVKSNKKVPIREENANDSSEPSL